MTRELQGKALSSPYEPFPSRNGLKLPHVSMQIPGVPIMYITQHKYSIERLPEATIGGGKLLLFFLSRCQRVVLPDLASFRALHHKAAFACRGKSVNRTVIVLFCGLVDARPKVRSCHSGLEVTGGRQDRC